MIKDQTIHEPFRRRQIKTTVSIPMKQVHMNTLYRSTLYEWRKLLCEWLRSLGEWARRERERGSGRVRKTSGEMFNETEHFWMVYKLKSRSTPKRCIYFRNVKTATQNPGNACMFMSERKSDDESDGRMRPQKWNAYFIIYIFEMHFATTNSTLFFVHQNIFVVVVAADARPLLLHACFSFFCSFTWRLVAHNYYGNDWSTHHLNNFAEPFILLSISEK